MPGVTFWVTLKICAAVISNFSGGGNQCPLAGRGLNILQFDSNPEEIRQNSEVFFFGTSFFRCRTCKFVFCCYKRITLASSVQKKLNKSYWNNQNILCDLLLTVVHCTLINFKPKLCFINMIKLSYCGKSHWNGVKSSLLTKF